MGLYLLGPLTETADRNTKIIIWQILGPTDNAHEDINGLALFFTLFTPQNMIISYFVNEILQEKERLTEFHDNDCSLACNA